MVSGICTDVGKVMAMESYYRQVEGDAGAGWDTESDGDSEWSGYGAGEDRETRKLKESDNFRGDEEEVIRDQRGKLKVYLLTV